MIAIWTVEHPRTRRDGRTYALEFFSVAFITLALTSYVTAITSGETDCNRASVEEAFSGGALGIGASAMLGGLAWLLVALSEQVGELKRILRYTLSGVGLLIAFMLALSAVGVGEQLLGGRSHAFVTTVPWGLGAVLLIGAAVAALRGPREDPRIGAAVTAAALAALADGILSALCCGIGGGISIGFWLRAPVALIYGIVVLMIIMPGIALVTAARAITGAVTPGPRNVTAAATVTASAPPLEASQPRQPQLPVEPMTTDLLRKRSLDTFSGGYLTFVAIIQGVALAVLAEHGAPLLAEHGHSGWWRFTASGQVASTFMAILIVTSEYLWFTSVVGWPLTFVDTLAPYALGACEITTAQFIGHPSAWWFSFAVLTGAGVSAYSHTYAKCAMVPFESPNRTRQQMVSLIQRQPVTGAIFCVLLLAATLTMGVLSVTDPRSAAHFLAFAAWLPVGLAPVLIVLSERGLNELYRAYGLDRLGKGSK